MSLAIPLKWDELIMLDIQNTNTVKEDIERPNSEWPLLKLVVIYMVALFLAVLLLPSLDGHAANNSRNSAFICVSLMYWIRIALAKKRKEKNRDYRFYSILMIGHVFLIGSVHSWLNAVNFPALDSVMLIFIYLKIY